MKRSKRNRKGAKRTAAVRGRPLSGGHSAIPRATGPEILQGLWEAMLAVRDGRITPAEGLAIGMIAEEQFEMLFEKNPPAGQRGSGPGEAVRQTGKGRDRFHRWVN